MKMHRLSLTLLLSQDMYSMDIARLSSAMPKLGIVPTPAFAEAYWNVTGDLVRMKVIEGSESQFLSDEKNCGSN
jgi:hypothetical protein